MSMDYYNVIFMFTISDENTRKDFVDEINKEYGITFFDQSTYASKTTASFNNICTKIEDICKNSKWVFDDDDFISICCAAKYADANTSRPMAMIRKSIVLKKINKNMTIFKLKQ